MLNKRSIGIAFAGVGLMLILLGLISLGIGPDDALLSYMKSVLGLMTFLILLSEIGFKMITNVSNLKKFGILQGISLMVAIAVLFSAILNLPFIGLENFTISLISSLGIMVGGVIFLLEAFTNQVI